MPQTRLTNRDLSMRERGRRQARDFNVFFSRIPKNVRTGKLHCTFFFSPEKSAQFFKPSPDRHMMKLLTVDNLFPSLRNSR